MKINKQDVSRVVIDNFFLRQQPVIAKFFDENKVECDCLLNVLARLDKETLVPDAGGVMRVNDAVMLISRMSDDLSKEQISQLTNKIADAQKSPEWQTSARVLLVWESGLAFTLVPRFVGNN